MFAVLFEVRPEPAQWDAYLHRARLLRPELEEVEGFVDNIRYASLTREGWLLSLSNWRDEKALVRWRTTARHHAVQQEGRAEILADYRLRVGQLTADTRPPPGCALTEQRLDETEAGPARSVALIDATRAGDLAPDTPAREIAERLGLAVDAPGLVAWDIFDAVLTPGDLILMLSWRDAADADAWAAKAPAQVSPGARLRRVRIIRDYGLTDRRESPQYYPDVVRAGRA